MAVRYVAGDIFHTSSPHAIAYGCNASGSRGRGMSAELYDRWPALYDEYRTHCATGHLGSCFSWQESSHTVFGLVIQKTWQSRPSLVAVRVAVASMIAKAQDLGITEIAIPRIGTGLHGLDWPDVRDVIKDIAECSTVAAVVFDRFVAGLAPR